jgi:lysophospholipase L1-like esterase
MLIPPFLHKMVWTLDSSDRRARRRFVEKLQHRWGDISRTVAAWDRPSVPGHLSPERFANQMNRVVSQTIAHTRAVVVIIDVHPVNDYLRVLGDAYEFRRERLQTELEKVAQNKRRVGLLRLEEVQHEVGGSKDTFPDGIHLSPAAHRVLAQRIAQLYFALEDD